MYVYRITSTRYAHDISGEGARLYGGRWNSKGTRMLYTAENPALAMLEALAHITSMSVQREFSIVQIACPDEWFLPEKNLFRKITVDNIPANWQQSPPPEALATIGDNFMEQGKFIALQVPSVLIPECSNYLFNCQHSLFTKLKISEVKPVRFDMRLIHNS